MAEKKKSKISADAKYSAKVTIIVALLSFVVGGTGGSFITFHQNEQNINQITIENKKEIENLEKENDALNKQLTDLSKGIIENEEGIKTGDLMEIAAPYNTETYNMKIHDGSSDESIKIAGTEYSKGIVLEMSYNEESCGYALINLNAAYHKLSFEYGHIDGSSTGETTLAIEGDGRVLDTVSLKHDEGLKKTSVDVSGVKILKIRLKYSKDFNNGEYGIVNLNIE